MNGTRLQWLRDYRLPFWRFLAPSFLASLVLMLQWVYQQVEFWNRNHVFPASDGERSGQLFANVTSGMVTYYFDLFAELATNSVPWAAIAAIIFTLCWLGRSAQSLQPSMGEYRLLGLLFAYVVVGTGSWYVGFIISITFAIAFVIVGFVLPWARRFNPLATIRVRRGDVREQKAKCALLTVLPGPTDLRDQDLRGQLVTRQMHMDALRERARSLAGDLSSGKGELSAYALEREKITSSLAEYRFPPGLRAPFTILRQNVAANGSVGQWQLPRSVRPADVALAIGPGTGWWDNGVIAAKIGAKLSVPATIYFSYIRAEDEQTATFNSYLGSLHLLSYVVWEVGFWVVAAFVLGCLWTTLPGRQGFVKGAVLWAGFAIPFAVDFALGRQLLHQDPVTGAWLRVPLLLLELLLVGLVFDWFTLRDTDTFRIHKWQPLVTLYGVRRLVPTLVVVVPLLAALVAMYFQLRTGLTAPGVPLQPATSPREGG
jgi:hypothetical protein